MRILIKKKKSMNKVTTNKKEISSQSFTSRFSPSSLDVASKMNTIT